VPELPEVETVARGLRAVLPGRRLLAAHLHRASIFRGDPQLLADLAGATVVSVRRGGKYLVVEFRHHRRLWQMLFHLGMTGQLVVQPEGAPELAHTHAVLEFSGGRALHFRDPRRFGRMGLAPAPAGGGFAPELGVAAGAEPLDVTPEEFTARLHGRAAPIKSALLNQKLLRGLGNIYADESLFRAGIHPRAHHLSRRRLAGLHLAVRAVLQEAIRAGGSSISDYVGSDGAPGWFHLQHRVYGRTGEPCLVCGAPIRRVVLGGRSAHFCAHCQKR
jgi:formamidopyrimidine-DNA glycosylase